MSKATVYKTTGEVIELDHVPGLEEAQKIVGGYVERVFPMGTAVVMLCNEDGGPMGLPFNEKGAALYGGRITGDVVVFARKDGRKWL